MHVNYVSFDGLYDEGRWELIKVGKVGGALGGGACA